MRQTTLTTLARRVRLTLLLMPLVLVTAAAARAPRPVEWTAGRLSIHAEQVPLAALLQEVARQTGMAIHGLTGLHEPISVHFAGLSLYQGLQRLPVNFALVWEPVPGGDPRPVRALIVGRREPSSPTGTGSAPGEPLQAEARAVPGTAWPAAAVPPPPEPVGAPADEGPSAVAVQRLEALQRLVAEAAAPTVLAALRHALAEEDLTMKSYAIHALATRPGAEAQEALRQALHNPDPTVRLMVVEQLAQQDPSHGLLQDALTDPEEAVRFVAATALELTAWHER